MIEILEEDHVDLGRQKANTNFETIQVHLDSQENPHGVTAVQVGAVPVSSWGTVLAEGVDLNTVLSPGVYACLLYTSPSQRDRTRCLMPSSA